ncbi:MAG: purine-nucleoside phosphorylase [Candidatus Nanopelagicales bacterium]
MSESTRTDMTDPNTLAREAATELARLTGVARHDIAIVLGSGWVPAADLLGDTDLDLSVNDLPGFRAAGVAGHEGRVRSIQVGDHRVLVFLGRTHLYEGHGVDAVVHRVRVAAAAGCRTLILTNACGGLNTQWQPGTPVLIRDHINLTGVTPLLGAQFVDMTDAYSPQLRKVCKSIAPGLAEGVYVQFHGPQYETPAEIEMVRAIGGDLVGMSTALETIAARAVGMDVLGISLVTNIAAGITGEPLNHEEVLAAGQASAQRMGQLMADVVRQI